VLVSEKLRISLTRFAGADGFAALFRRALVLAEAEVPSRQSVKIDRHGHLEGFEQLAADTGASPGSKTRGEHRDPGSSEGEQGDAALSDKLS
jgi:hypothetical protein